MHDLDSHLETLANHGYAPGSIRSYFLALRRFIGWLDSREPTGAVCNAYIKYLQVDLALRPRSIRPAAAAIRGYLAWLHGQGKLTTMPASIKLPALDAPDSYCPTDAEMERLWKAIEALPQKTSHQRYVRRRTLTVMALLAWAGLRHSELHALEADDIDLEARQIRIRYGKGGKTDWLPLASPDLRDYLTEWVRVRADWVAQHQPLPEVAGALFHVDRRRRLGDAANRAMWDWLNAAVRPRHKLTDHCIRRYYGTTLNRRGAPLADTSRLMRHRSLKSTLDYLKWDEASISESASKLGRAVNQGEQESPVRPAVDLPPRVERQEGAKDRRAWLRDRKRSPGRAG